MKKKSQKEETGQLLILQGITQIKEEKNFSDLKQNKNNSS